MTTQLIRGVDLFCGAGGTSTGLALACEELDLRVDLLAINHWDVAIETHKANHPWARHLCRSLHEVNPRHAVPAGRLDLLVASPECTHHSNARGGRPVSDQMRMSAWQVVDWLSALRVENVIIENVREFQSWGPIDSRGRPLKSRRGETYQAFIHAIRSLGFAVEEQLLNAANYGDPTTRTRLFIVGRRGRRPIRWPQATHYHTDLLGLGPRWVSARAIIDWSIPTQSIFSRKRPLSANTIARIAAGLRKFSGLEFIVPQFGEAGPRSVERPLGTLTTTSRGVGLVQPFLVALRGTAADQVKSSVRSVDEPTPTVMANGNHLGVVEPFILPPLGYYHRDGKANGPRSVETPLQTLTSRGGGHLVEPFLVPFFGERDGQAPRSHSVDEPLPAVTSHGAGGLVEPFLCAMNHGTTHGRGNGGRTRSVERPMPTLTAAHGLALVEPFLVKYNRTGGPRSVDEPLDTLTTHDRFALVEIGGTLYALDVRFRMLQPHELARAMGFPEGYVFTGTRAEQVRQIGNAVAVNTAKALCKSVLR